MTVILATLLRSEEGHVTSYGVSSGVQFEGFMLSVDVPTNPNPNDSEKQSANQYLEKVLRTHRAMAEKAFRFFAYGHHPYSTYRSYLMPKFRFPGLKGQEVPLRVRVSLNDAVAVEIYVKPNTPDAIRAKLTRDFLLAQISQGGILEQPSIKYETTGAPTAVLEKGLYSVWQIAYAVEHQKEIHHTLETRKVGAAGPRDLVLEGVDSVLRGQPFSESLVAAALQVRPGRRDDVLCALVEMSTGADQAQLTRLINGISPAKRYSYEGLTQPAADAP